jgi:hypothetical protein
VAATDTVDGLLRREMDGIDVVLLDLLLADRSDPADNVGRLAAAGPRVLVVSVVADPDQIVTPTRRVPPVTSPRTVISTSWPSSSGRSPPAGIGVRPSSPSRWHTTSAPDGRDCPHRSCSFCSPTPPA